MHSSSPRLPDVNWQRNSLKLLPLQHMSSLSGRSSTIHIASERAYALPSMTATVPDEGRIGWCIESMTSDGP